MRQPLVFQRGAGLRRRVARALVLLVGGGLVAWVGLVATAVVPNGGTVELPDFVGPLQRPPAPRVGVAGAGPLLRVVPSPLRGAAGRGRVAVVVRAPGAETRRLSGALAAEGIRATFALSALDVLADRTLPAFVTGHGHEVAFAGYADADATRLPEAVWIANESLGRRILERASEREVRLYLPGRLLGGELHATALETARRAEP